MKDLGLIFFVSETCGTRYLTVSNIFETSGGTTATFGGQATFNDNADFTGNITATNLTASSSIRANTSFVYPNSTVQSSAYTGGPAGIHLMLIVKYPLLPMVQMVREVRHYLRHSCLVTIK